MKDNKPGPNFNANFISYDIHTYYNQNYEGSRQEAKALYDKLVEDFSDEIAKGELNVYDLVDEPAGIHPIGMWEIDFKSPELFSRLVPWYQWNHGNLSVLVHPFSSKGARADHTNHALWIGDRVNLIKDKL
ncbi:uncharacterized protein SAPINGB_P005772 [Magnusiomyces paraingens]|uniref:DOPA 4,5-dioxygenase n=1 Tax=Magnusiomyces paraingens TaxID=2606893 RepID=A0A5E8C2M4_9ASCO|nr:uncharacterized protein SAPINGB_P005772 [Saprochaete ingens]VVT57592.1 unnamed protein product [Saprochaete ingens]